MIDLRKYIIESSNSNDLSNIKVPLVELKSQESKARTYKYKLEKIKEYKENIEMFLDDIKNYF